MTTQLTMGPDYDTGAIFSKPQADYRYLLWRQLGPSRQTCLFVMLNPSVADAVRLDPTVTKCIHWVREWGFGRLEVVNIFAYIATDPYQIKQGYEWIVGPDNDQFIGEAIDRADRVIVAWGDYGTIMDRGQHVLDMMRQRKRSAYCFGVTKGNKQPRHPVRLGYQTKIINIDQALADAGQ